MEDIFLRPHTLYANSTIELGDIGLFTQEGIKRDNTLLGGKDRPHWEDQGESRYCC
jgi:hypothetical protein